MKAEVVVQHSTPVRARLQVASRKHDQEFFSVICDTLQGCRGVESVRANLLTGSVVLEHRDDLKGILHEFQLKSPVSLAVTKTKPAKVEPLAQTYQSTLKKNMKALDKTLLKWTGGGVDFISMAGLGLIGLSVLQLRRGAFLPAGLTLALLSFRLANASIPIEVGEVGMENS